MPTDKFFFGTFADDKGATALHGTDSTSFVDHMYGFDGNDELFGYGGIDFIQGNAGHDLLDGGSGIDYLDGGPGYDTVTYAKSAAAVNVDLATGETSGGDAASDSLSTIENVTGSKKGDVLEGGPDGNVLKGEKGVDVLYGNGGVDVIFGGDGKDFIDGGAQRDLLIGGANADTFDYNSALASLPGANRDKIYDFSHAQKDKINLSDIAPDADFIGTSAFTAAGQVRYVKGPNETVIQVNYDADGAPEMEIELIDPVDLTAGDFVL